MHKVLTLERVSYSLITLLDSFVYYRLIWTRPLFGKGYTGSLGLVRPGAVCWRYVIFVSSGHEAKLLSLERLWRIRLVDIGIQKEFRKLNIERTPHRDKLNFLIKGYFQS